MEDKPFLQQLAEAHDEVIQAMTGPLRDAWRTMQEDKPWEVAAAFFRAIDWTEPWLLALAGAQAALFVSVIALRRSSAYLSAVFVVGASLVYFGERINALLAARWRAFATQPYFDERGTFYAAVVAGPLIATMLAALVCYLLLTVSLMAEVKKAQLRAAARGRQGQRQQQQDGGGGGREIRQSKKTQ